jgi:hypothetical protein
MTFSRSLLPCSLSFFFLYHDIPTYMVATIAPSVSTVVGDRYLPDHHDPVMSRRPSERSPDGPLNRLKGSRAQEGGIELF